MAPVSTFSIWTLLSQSCLIILGSSVVRGDDQLSGPGAPVTCSRDYYGVPSNSQDCVDAFADIPYYFEPRGPASRSQAVQNRIFIEPQALDPPFFPEHNAWGDTAAMVQLPKIWSKGKQCRKSSMTWED